MKTSTDPRHLRRREAVKILAVKFTVVPGLLIAIEVPLPGPGSLSKKYSAAVIFCDDAHWIVNKRSSRKNNFFIQMICE